MIYFIRNESAGLIKIGFSRSPRTRRSNLQSAAGVKLEIIGVMRGARKAEAVLHERFAEDRVRGEWFRASEALERFIAENAQPIDSIPEEPGRANSRYRETFAAALRKRLMLDAPAQVQYFCRAIGIDSGTLRGWLDASRSPSFEMICVMAEHFRKEGDLAFIGEIFGYHPPKAKAITDYIKASDDLVAIIKGYPDAEYKRALERATEMIGARKRARGGRHDAA